MGVRFGGYRADCLLGRGMVSGMGGVTQLGFEGFALLQLPWLGGDQHSLCICPSLGSNVNEEGPDLRGDSDVSKQKVTGKVLAP